MALADGRLEAAKIADTLTKREKDLLSLLIGGQSLSSIAEQLLVDIELLIAVRKSLMAKIGAKHTADAVRVGLELARHRLLELPESEH
jgi:two-component system, LuxR family, response regulator FixJ